MPGRKRAATTEKVEPDGTDLALGELLDELNSGEGKGSAFRLSDDGLSIHLPGVVTTGSEYLDLATGRGGIPLGRITLLSGNEGSGKTTLALNLCRNVQKMGGVAVYIDAEYKLDRDYAAALGVDLERLILSQPEHMEHALEVINKVTEIAKKSTRPIVVVVDSLNSMPTEAELDGSDAPGQSSRTMSKGLRKLAKKIPEHRIALVLISQIRQKFGVKFGKQTTTGCGFAPRFYAALIFEMVPISAVKSGNQKVGHKTKIDITKNQVGPPYRKAELVIRYGSGIDWAHSLHEATRAAEVVEVGAQSRSVWSGPGGPAKWQGGEGLREVGEGNAEAIVGIVNELRGRYGWQNTAITLADVPALLAAGAPFESGGREVEEEEDEEEED